MIRPPAFACAVLAGLLQLICVVPDAWAFQQIRSAEVSRAEGYTRVILESDLPFRYTVAPRGSERVLVELEDIAGGGVLSALPAEVGADDRYIRSADVRRPGAGAVILEFRFRLAAQARATVLPAGPGHLHRLVLDIWPVPPTLPTTAEAAPALAEAEPMWLSVRLNAQAMATPALAWRAAGGQLFVRRDDLLKWRLDVPDSAAVRHEGEDVVPIAALPGVTAQLDEAAQSVELVAPANTFLPTSLATTPDRVLPMPATMGGFANYDVAVERSDGDDQQMNGLLEAGSYGPWGVVTTQGLHRDDGDARSTVRLESTWTQDDPLRMIRHRVGDTISRAASWGGAVRIGGLQFSRNFATRPGVSTLPPLQLAGEAALPSTVDLYVNDALRLRSRVPPGPFTVPDLPAVSGRGEVRMIVRDLLGREQIITQPFYNSPRLLRPGLHDFSYEVGALRENYGLSSSDYGPLLASATHRLGLSDHLTAEAHAELLTAQQTVGVGLVQNLTFGILSGAVSASDSKDGRGGLWSLGFERQGRHVGVGVEARRASASYHGLGWQSGADPLRATTRAYFSASAGRLGTFGAAYTRLDHELSPAASVVSASYGLGLMRHGYLSLTALKTLAPTRHATIGLTYTHVLGDRTSYNVSATTNGDDPEARLQVQRNLPAGSGFGYRLRHSDGAVRQDSATLLAQGPVGRYELEAVQQQDKSAWRASASGGLVAVSDGIFASGRIADAFAMVHVPGQAGVGIYADNQLVARTDSSGRALVPQLRAYQSNPLRIDLSGLPLDVEIGRTTFDAVPTYRSGVVVRFPVRQAAGATMTVLLEDGRPMPAGARARIEGEGEIFPVANSGLLYLTGLGSRNRILVSWQGRECGFDLVFPAGADPLPDLGIQYCRESTP